MSKERLKEKEENQYRAKVDKIFDKYTDEHGVTKMPIPEDVPPPSDGDWWGPWRYDAKRLVLEYYDEYPVRDASVILFDNLDDWWDQAYPLVEGFTNQYGRVTFSNLFEQHYYIDAWEDYHNNWALADEDTDWIRTDRLYPNEMNFFIAYVDYVPPTLKSDGRPAERMKLMKLEKLDKRAYEERLEAIQEKSEQRKVEFDNEVEHQDAVVAREALSGFAAEVSGPEEQTHRLASAIGQLTEAHARRARDSRAEFFRAWKRFDQKKVRKPLKDRLNKLRSKN